MITSSPIVPRRAFEEGTGWELKPEGACKGGVCVPTPDVTGDEVDIRHLADVIGLPLVTDETQGLWALGSHMTSSQRALSSAVAPNLVLPDVNGEPFDLETLRGEKVILLAWAPY